MFEYVLYSPSTHCSEREVMVEDASLLEENRLGVAESNMIFFTTVIRLLRLHLRAAHPSKLRVSRVCFPYLSTIYSKLTVYAYSSCLCPR